MEASEPVNRQSATIRLLAAALLGLALLTGIHACTKGSAGSNPTGSGNGEEPASTTTSGRASLQFHEEVFEFGTVFQQDEVHHQFHFTNTGERTLRITQVKATCGCTIPRYPTDPIPPGYSGAIDLTLQPGALIGDIDKKLIVRTDAPDLDDIELTVSGTIEIPFYTDPHQTDLGKMYSDTPIEPKSIKVSWLTELGIEITEIGRTSESIEILSRTPFEEDGRKGETIEFQLTDWESTLDPSQGGKYHQFVVIKTNHPQYPRTMHAVVGHQSAPITPTPKIVNFGVVDAGGSGAVQRVRLASRPGVEWTVEGLDGPEYLIVKNQTTSSSPRGDVKTIELELLPTGVSGSIKEHVKLRTSLPSQPEVSIYVVANVREER